MSHAEFMTPEPLKPEAELTAPTAVGSGDWLDGSINDI